MELMSLRAYAKRRGTYPNAVSEAVRTGRLVKSVVRVNERGEVDPNGNVPKIADPVLADQEWAANTNPAPRGNVAAPAAPVAPVALPPAESPQTAQQRYTSAKADKMELELAEAAGKLVSAHEVEQRLAGIFTACKTKLLAIPSRARQALPHLTNADVVAVDKLIREALEDLANGDT